MTAEQMAEMTWVKPTVVAQIRFVEWTNDGHLRHAALLGLRSDKRATEIRREAYKYGDRRLLLCHRATISSHF